MGDFKISAAYTDQNVIDQKYSFSKKIIKIDLRTSRNMNRKITIKEIEM